MTPAPPHGHFDPGTSGLPSMLTAVPMQHARRNAPLVLTASELIKARPGITDGLRQARCRIWCVAGWEHLLEGAQRIAADIVLVDLDALELSSPRRRISGARLIVLLARALMARRTALVVLTSLDFTEVEDLVRLGVDGMLAPATDPAVVPLHMRAAVRRRQQRYLAHRAHILHRLGPRARHTLQLPAANSATDATTLLSDALWARVQPLLPAPASGRRPRVPDRHAIEALFWLLGDPSRSWSSLPRTFGGARTLRARLCSWREAGVFQRLHAMGWEDARELAGLDWSRLPVLLAIAPRTVQAPRVSSGAGEDRVLRVQPVAAVRKVGAAPLARA